MADDYYLQLYHGTVACEGLSALMLGDIIQADQASPPVLYQVHLADVELLVNVS